MLLLNSFKQNFKYSVLYEFYFHNRYLRKHCYSQSHKSTNTYITEMWIIIPDEKITIKL